MAVASMHLGAWHSCWCKTGRCVDFTICSVTGIFTHNYGLQRMVWKGKNIQYAAVLWARCYPINMGQHL